MARTSRRHRQSGEPDVAHESSDWRHIAPVVLASLFGVGLLALPGAFQRLGWLPALLVLIFGSLVSMYAGSLYARLLAACPWITTYTELGTRALGPRWGVALVSCTAYLAIFLVPIILHLACAQSLQEVFPEGHAPSLLMSGFGVAVVIMVLAQIRFLRQMSWLSAGSSVIMAAAMLLVVWKLALVDPSPEGGAHTRLVEQQPFLPAMVGVLDVLFVFSGQEAWVRYLAAMGPHRRQFSKSTTTALGLMTPFVALVGAVGYAMKGGSLDLSDPITTHLVPDTTARIINAGVLVALLVAYAIHINVCTETLLEMVAPRLFKPSAQAHAAHHLPHSSSRGQHSALDTPLLSHAEPAGPVPQGGSSDALRVQLVVEGEEAVQGDAQTRVVLLPPSSAGQTQRKGAPLPASAHQPPWGSGSEAGEEGMEDEEEGHHSIASALYHNGTAARMLWALTSVSFVLAAWLLGAAFPKFAEMEGVIASLGAISAQILLPCLFGLFMLSLRWWERALCGMLCVVSVALTGVGLWASLSQLL